MTASRLHPAVPDQHAYRRPLVSVDCLSRVLLRQASGPEPEKKLAVAVICRAIEDCRPDPRVSLTRKEARYQAAVQRQAIRFMQGTALDAWASAFDLDARFIRELAIKTGYWHAQSASATASTTTNVNSQERRTHAGFQ
jgi:hypothetical protein